MSTLQNNSGLKFGEKCVFMHKEVRSQPNKKPKKTGGTGTFFCFVEELHATRQGYRAAEVKGTKSLRRKRSVQVSEGTLRPVKIREIKGPSQGFIQRSDPHERSPYAAKIENRSEEETLKQERCARRVAGKMAKSIHMLKEKDYATYILRAFRGLVFTSAIFNETRGNRISGGASMHMRSRKDLNSAELDTMRASRNPSTVVTENGDVQTHEEATLYVNDLDLFVTVQILEDTPAVLSLGTLSEEDGYSYEFIRGQKTTPCWKTAERYNATRKTLCRSLSQDYQPSLPIRLQVHLQHRYRRTPQKTLRPVQRPYEVAVEAVQHWETTCTNPNRQKTKIRTSIQYWETGCVICQNGWRNLVIIQWKKKFLPQMKHPQTERSSQKFLEPSVKPKSHTSLLLSEMLNLRLELVEDWNNKYKQS